MHCRKGTQALSRQLRKALGSRNQDRISIRFHLILEGALRNQDVRSDWFSFEWLPSSCWIKFRFYLLGEPALFHGSPTFAFIASHRVLLCQVHFVIFFSFNYSSFGYRIVRQTKTEWKNMRIFCSLRSPTNSGRRILCFKSTLALCSRLWFCLAQPTIFPSNSCSGHSCIYSLVH